MRFRELPLRTDIYPSELTPRFEAVDRALLDGDGASARSALDHLTGELETWVQREGGFLEAREREAAVDSLLEIKAALCCLAQRAFVTFWSRRAELDTPAQTDCFLELYQAYLQAFYDTFVDVSPDRKEPENRRYNQILLEAASSDEVYRRAGRVAVNDVSRMLVDRLTSDRSEHLWNEATTAYYAGRSKFGINIFVENYDGYLRDLLFYFDASKDFVADTAVERFRHSPPDRPFRMLEPGAGTGDLIFRIAARLEPAEANRFHYLGFDLSPDMRARFDARRAATTSHPALERARLELGNAVHRESWPEGIEEQSFDLVALTFMLHHVYPPRRRPFLEAAAQTLRPGGRFIFLEGTEEHAWFKPYHDPQDVESLEFFEPFHRVFERGSVAKVTLVDHRFFPEIEVERAGRRTTSGWAVASIGRRSKWGCYGGVIEPPGSFVHPDDAEAFESISPTGKVLECVGEEGGFLRLNYRDRDYRVKSDRFVEVPEPKARIDERITLRDTGEAAVIREILWHYEAGEPYYFLLVNGKKRSKRYWNADFLPGPGDEPEPRLPSLEGYE